MKWVLAGLCLGSLRNAISRDLRSQWHATYSLLHGWKGMAAGLMSGQSLVQIKHTLRSLRQQKCSCDTVIWTIQEIKDPLVFLFRRLPDYSFQ